MGLFLTVRILTLDNKPDISVDFAGLKLANPVMTASGTCGYADELSSFFDVSSLGGFITKSITLEPRLGNPPPRIVETNAGMLNAIGLANLGVERFIAEKLPIIEKMATKVFVNLVSENNPIHYNKSMYEFITKYGDAGADILPLGNLLKSQVRELAEYLGIPKKL